MKNKVYCWTDGSCDVHSVLRPGGWAYLIIDQNNEIEDSGGSLRTTSNQMELNAILELLWGLNGLEDIKEREVIIYSDSEWSIKCLIREYNCTKKQKKTGKVGGHVAWLNAIWAKMGEYELVRFVWIPAHADNVNNNRMNDLAIEKMEWARANLR